MVNEELKTIFARGVHGSFVLDILPEAVGYLRARSQYSQMYMQDHAGRELIIPQGSSVEQAAQLWREVVDRSRKIQLQIAESETLETSSLSM